jgi:hypothetical protein
MPTSTNNEQLETENKKLEVNFFLFWFFRNLIWGVYRQQFVIQQFKWVVGQRLMIIY